MHISESPLSTFRKISRSVFSTFLISVLFGCTTPSRVDVTTKERPEQYNFEVYNTLPPSKVFKISMTTSVLRVYVGREGPLSNLGHNHVISSNNLSGYIYLPDNTDQAFGDLVIPVHDLIVDNANERSLAGEDKLSTMSESIITKTQANMLHRDVLDAANYPEVGIHIQLTELNGENAKGKWKLKVADEAPSDDGVLEAWSMRICTAKKTLGIDKNSLDDFQVYPNPTEGQFTVIFSSEELGDVSISVYDLLGRKLLEKSYKDTSIRFEEVFNARNLTSGIYILKVRRGQYASSRKLKIK